MIDLLLFNICLFITLSVCSVFYCFCTSFRLKRERGEKDREWERIYQFKHLDLKWQPGQDLAYFWCQLINDSYPFRLSVTWLLPHYVAYVDLCRTDLLTGWDLKACKRNLDFSWVKMRSHAISRVVNNGIRHRTRQLYDMWTCHFTTITTWLQLRRLRFIFYRNEKIETRVWVRFFIT